MLKKYNTKELIERAKWVRRKLFEVAVNTGQAHLGGALSSVELLLSLYNGGILNITPKTINSPDRDRLIYSKGHCPLALYTILADNGFFTIEELEKYGSTSMPGHSDYHTPGIEMTGGSLGHGLGLGCGIALAAKLDKKDYKTYVYLGDTECNEGSIWEGVMFASAQKLNNLIVIVDNNKFGTHQLTTTYTGSGLLKEKWASFHWNTYVCDGHNFEQIISCLNFIKNHKTDAPSVIIAGTIKGKGISYMENNPIWHHGIPKGEELEIARRELK
jgi:transketolase